MMELFTHPIGPSELKFRDSEHINVFLVLYNFLYGQHCPGKLNLTLDNFITLIFCTYSILVSYFNIYVMLLIKDHDRIQSLYAPLDKASFCIKASKSLYKSADVQLVSLVEHMGTVGICSNLYTWSLAPAVFFGEVLEVHFQKLGFRKNLAMVLTVFGES